MLPPRKARTAVSASQKRLDKPVSTWLHPWRMRSARPGQRSIAAIRSGAWRRGLAQMAAKVGELSAVVASGAVARGHRAGGARQAVVHRTLRPQVSADAGVRSVHRLVR